eukprot:jgi/Chlat1/7690/Chrsp64S07180
MLCLFAIKRVRVTQRRDPSRKAQQQAPVGKDTKADASRDKQAQLFRRKAPPADVAHPSTRLKEKRNKASAALARASSPVRKLRIEPSRGAVNATEAVPRSPVSTRGQADVTIERKQKIKRRLKLKKLAAAHVDIEVTAAVQLAEEPIDQFQHTPTAGRKLLAHTPQSSVGKSLGGKSSLKRPPSHATRSTTKKAKVSAEAPGSEQRVYRVARRITLTPVATRQQEAVLDPPQQQEQMPELVFRDTEDATEPAEAPLPSGEHGLHSNTVELVLTLLESIVPVLKKLLKLRVTPKSDDGSTQNVFIQNVERRRVKEACNDQLVELRRSCAAEQRDLIRNREELRLLLEAKRQSDAAHLQIQRRQLHPALLELQSTSPNLEDPALLPRPRALASHPQLPAPGTHPAVDVELQTLKRRLASKLLPFHKSVREGSDLVDRVTAYSSAFTRFTSSLGHQQHGADASMTLAPVLFR